MSQQPLSAATSSATKLKKGDPYVWLGAVCAGIILLLFACLVSVVFYNGLGIFWVDEVRLFTLKDQSKVLASVASEDADGAKTQFYTANRDLLGLDYRWVDNGDIVSQEVPDAVVMLERVEKGNFLGFLRTLKLKEETLALEPAPLWERLQSELIQMKTQVANADAIQKRMTKINREIEKSQIKAKQATTPAEQQRLANEQLSLRHQYEELNATLDTRRGELGQFIAVMEQPDGSTHDIALMNIVHAYQPNQMGVFAKLGFYFGKIHELLLTNPRESNTEGGLFPAILGTVLMVMLMSLFCVPLGVVAAVYLREYAREGILVNLVRIAVNNLAGVPSIVYGMFGLGFFVYGVGGMVDSLFFPERAPIPTFGTGGLLWASLTMALLTVPVVIVSTEEGLSSVPQGVRDGSMALGATKFQTLIRVVLPMATPGMLTGLILAIARAAGEVAPLMLVGVVKSVQSLPVTSEFPFVQLDHKIMHLGFHIYDVGFQSPNVEAAKPMVYVTTLLLLGLVLAMSFLAMYLRNRMKKRYTLGAF